MTPPPQWFRTKVYFLFILYDHHGSSWGCAPFPSSLPPFLPFLPFFFDWLHFLDQFYIRNNITKRYREFLYKPCPHTCTAPPHPQCPAPERYTCYNQCLYIDVIIQRPRFTLGFTPSVVHSFYWVSTNVWWHLLTNFLRTFPKHSTAFMATSVFFFHFYVIRWSYTIIWFNNKRNRLENQQSTWSHL